MDNVLQVKEAIKEDRCAFGTVDSWLLWVGLLMNFNISSKFQKKNSSKFN